MKIIIYGSNGWIGQQFIEVLKEKNVAYVKGVSRVDDYDNVVKEITTNKPSHVISFIGRIFKFNIAST